MFLERAATVRGTRDGSGREEGSGVCKAHTKDARESSAQGAACPVSTGQGTRRVQSVRELSATRPVSTGAQRGASSL